MNPRKDVGQGGGADGRSPERVWLWHNAVGERWFSLPGDTGAVEYVRADLAAPVPMDVVRAVYPGAALHLIAPKSHNFTHLILAKPGSGHTLGMGENEALAWLDAAFKVERARFHNGLPDSAPRCACSACLPAGQS